MVYPLPNTLGKLSYDQLSTAYFINNVMPGRWLTPIFENLTPFSNVQTRTQNGHIQTIPMKFCAVSLHVNYLSLRPIHMFFKCVRSAVHIHKSIFTCSMFLLRSLRLAKWLVEQRIKQPWYKLRGRTMQPNRKWTLYCHIRPTHANCSVHLPGKEFPKMQQQSSCAILLQI